MKSKKMLLLVLVLLAALGLSGCGNSTEMKNPMVERSSLAEIQTALGFTFDNLPNNITSLKLYTIADTTAQADFTLDNVSYTARKAPLTATDISGVYDKFAETRTVPNADGIPVLYQYNPGEAGLATWSANDFTYSLYCPAGFSNTLMQGVVDQIQ